MDDQPEPNNDAVNIIGDNPLDNILPAEPTAEPQQPPMEPEVQPEIDDFLTVEISGRKWILGLALDSKVYNWDVTTGSWHLFIAPADPTTGEVAL